MRMKILRAVGLGLAIIILKVSMPEVFAGFEHFLLSFFSAGDVVFEQVQHAASVGLMELPALQE